MNEDNKGEVKATTEEPKKEKGVSKKEFTALETKVNEGFGAIMNMLESMKQTPVAPVTEPAKVEGGPDEETPIPSAWRKLVKEILGPDFDCELSLPATGGTIFKIVVPKEKSNASQMHWTQFKRDVRSRELGNTGEKGVKEWCLKVRRNLLNAGMKLTIYP